MLKTEEGKATESQPVSALLQTTPAPTTGNNASMAALKNAWGASLIIKIVACAIGGLFLLFFILMIVFAAKSTCTSYKDTLTQRDKTISTMNKTISTQSAQLAECTSSLGSCQQRETVCDGNLKTCTSDKKTLEEKVAQLTKEKEACTSDLTKCHDDVTTLQNKVRELEGKVGKKDEEIKNLNTEIHNLNTTLQNTKSELTKYQYGVIGGAVAVVGETIAIIVQWSRYSSLEQEKTKYENLYRDINGTVQNLKDRLKEKEAELEKAAESLRECLESKRQLGELLAAEREITKKLREEIDQLHWQIEPVPKLALDQAKLMLLQEEAKLEISHELVYNATDVGFDKATFLAKISAKRPLVFVARTESGYVFGGGMNISWPNGDNAYGEDPAAYTFSTTRDKICKIKPSDVKTAVYNTRDNFVQFGVGEFIIGKGETKHATGEATADKSYDCGASEGEGKHQWYNNGQYFTLRDFAVYQVFIKKPGRASN